MSLQRKLNKMCRLTIKQKVLVRLVAKRERGDATVYIRRRPIFFKNFAKDRQSSQLVKIWCNTNSELLKVVRSTKLLIPREVKNNLGDEIPQDSNNLILNFQLLVFVIIIYTQKKLWLQSLVNLSPGLDPIKVPRNIFCFLSLQKNFLFSRKKFKPIN